MDQHEKTVLKAACVQAAAILIAGLQPPPQAQSSLPRAVTPMAPDTGNCERFARDLFGKLTNEPWD